MNQLEPPAWVTARLGTTFPVAVVVSVAGYMLDYFGPTTMAVVFSKPVAFRSLY